MIDTFVLLAPIYLLGVMALLGFIGCFTKPPFVGDTSLPLIVDQTPGGIRNESGWYGMTIIAGPEKLTVRALGRYFLEGNNGMHRIRIVDPTGPTDIGLTMVNMAAASADPDDPYVYAYLTAPYPTLNPGAEYHLMSEEVASGDQFHDQDTTVRTIAQTIPDAVVKSAVYSDAPGLFVPVAAAEHSYGPVNIRYVVELND